MLIWGIRLKRANLCLLTQKGGKVQRAKFKNTWPISSLPTVRDRWPKNIKEYDCDFQIVLLTVEHDTTVNDREPTLAIPNNYNTTITTTNSRTASSD